MPKRKRDDAEEAPAPKKPVRDRSKYSKNIAPGSTKAERKAARKLARTQRKKAKAEERKSILAAGGEAAERLKKTLAKKEAAALAKNGKKGSKNVNADGTPIDNAKTRRKAARKAAKEAEKDSRRVQDEAATADNSDDEDSSVSESDAQSESDEESDGTSQDDTPVQIAAASRPEPEPVSETMDLDVELDAPATSEKAKKEKNMKKEKTKKKKADSAADHMKHDELAALPPKDVEPAVSAVSDKTKKSKKEKKMADVTAGYTEHSELAALPQKEIDEFLQAKEISVKDADPVLRPITSFNYLPDLGVSPFRGFSAPTPIQAATWPYLFAGKDVIGVAETGSGKTLAFGVPCMHRMMSLKKGNKHIKACIVSPTRELALQIQEQLSKFGQSYGLSVTCIYGGVDKAVQRAQIAKGTDIVVATPGRLNDFIGDGTIDLSHTTYLVLDEADRMLDKGFEDDVRKIASSAAQERQTLMFTATWPQSVRDLAATFMNNPVRINIGNASGELRANTRITQEVEVISPRDKQQRLFQLLKQYSKKNDRILVFCLYKKEATRIEEFIRYKGFNVAGIHGDLSQQKRQESLEAFKKGTVPLLVATDVAARGLDIPAVKLVINVTFPLTAEDYVHRIGRTGRAGQDGRAITFFTDEEKALAGALINVLKAANQPVPEELLKYGTTVKRKAHDAYGAFYKDPTDMKKATKITFD